MERARKCHNLDIWSLRTRPALNCSRGLDWTKGCVNKAESTPNRNYIGVSQISCACRWLGVSIWLLSPQDYTTTLARGKLIYSWSNSGPHFCLYMQRFSLCKYCRLKKCMSADALCFARGLLVIWETCQRSVTQTLRGKKNSIPALFS